MSEEMNEETGSVPFLRALRPARPEGLDRDQIMYEAGRAAAARAMQRRMRLWQGACAALVIACAGMGVGWVRGNATTDKPNLAETHTNLPAERHATSPTRGLAAVPVSASGGAEDDWAAISLPGLRPGTLARVLSGESTGGGVSVPALKKGDGLDALPVWQRRALMKGNNS